MLDFSQKYGPVCRFANPTALNAAAGWLFVNSPDDVQYMCSTNVRNYQRRYLPDIYKWVTHEKGILGSQDDYNARHRRLCQPPFRSKAFLQKFSAVISSRALELVDTWQTAGAHVTDVALQTQRLTLDVVGLTAFSHDFGQTAQISREHGRQAEKEDSLLWAVNTFGRILAQVFITPLPMLKFMERLGDPRLKTLTKAVNTMRDSMLEVIQGRREKMARGEDVPHDVLGMLLKAEDDEGHAMTDEELWEDVHDIMGAGHETTATTTAAVLYCVSAHPHVVTKVRAELDAVIGADGRAPTYEQLEQLPYLAAVVSEVLRLYPPIPIFPREALVDDVLPSGDAVLSGDVVFMSSYALGRSPALWSDATTFRPERFFDEKEAKSHHRFQYLPFGAGPRMCLGAGFASMSVQTMAAVLLHHFDFVPIHPTQQEIPVDYDITMNFAPTNGLKMRVSPRSP